MKDEIYLDHMNHLLRWHGPKAKFLIFGTVTGTLVVTNKRLLFLTEGKSGISGQFSNLGEQLSGSAPNLDDLDFELLDEPDSIAIDLDKVKRLEVKRRWDFASYITLRGIDERGDDVEVAFMPKMGLSGGRMRDLVDCALNPEEYLRDDEDDY